MKRMSFASGFLAAPALMLALTFSLLPESAAAYVGPGAGLTAIGTVFALVAAVFLAIVGFVWYPVKRMLKRSPATKNERG